MLSDRTSPGSSAEEQKTEVARLRKINRALMDRAERSSSVHGSDFSLFQATIMLEEQVRARTEELEAVLRENEKINRILRESEAKFRGLVSQSMVGIVIVENGTFTYSNAKFNDIYGYTEDEVRGLGPTDLATEDDRALVAQNMHKLLSGEVERVDYLFRGLCKNGAVIDIEMHGSAMEIDGRLALINLEMDVTERIRAERELQSLQERLQEQATHDPLTGLYNRRYLESAIGRELNAAERYGYPVSVIMADLDHFKSVNDRYGHLAGDEVLRVFSRVMKRHARASDICCRYGGEEFLLVMPHMEKDCAAERAECLRMAMAAAPTPFRSSPVSVTVSLGVATFPGDGRTYDELMVSADGALYAAKEAGRNCVHTTQTRFAEMAPPKIA
jgi:diguanylate cyclase (GGDEF)-like protein/PAS domain S-box-containing protein